MDPFCVSDPAPLLSVVAGPQHGGDRRVSAECQPLGVKAINFFPSSLTPRHDKLERLSLFLGYSQMLACKAKGYFGPFSLNLT
jgi:hypothetical protein